MVNDNQVITKSYVDQFHQENERSRQDVGLDFYDESSFLVENIQDNDFNDKKVTNIDSISINRKPIIDDEVSNNNIVDDGLNKILYLDLIKRYRIMSKYQLVMKSIILLKMIKYKLRLQLLLKLQIQVVNYSKNG